MLRGKADNRNALYGRIRRTIFVVVVLLVLLSSAFFYQYNLSLLTRNAEQADMQILKTHKEASETMHRLAYNITQQIFNDPQIGYLLYNTNFSATELLRSVALLNNYRSCIPYIESIYIYNDKLRSMTVSSAHSGGYDIPVWEGANESALFFDRADLIAILSGELRGSTRQAPIPRLIHYPEVYNSDVFCYTFVVSGGFGEEETLQEAVFVNFSVDWMRQITKENAGSESYTLVTNDEGLVIFSGINRFAQNDISSEELFQRIQLDPDTPQSFLASFDERKMLVSTLPVDANDWHYIRLTPYDSISRNMLGSLTLLLAVDAGLIVLGLLSTLVAAKWLYIPIVTISDRLDFAEKEKEALRRQQTLRRRLLGSAGRQEAGDDMGQGGYVLILRVQRGEDMPERGQLLLLLAEAARGAFPGYAERMLELDEGCSLALVLPGEAQEAEYWEESFDRLKAKMARQGIGLRGALSLWGEGEDWMAHGYRQAREAMRYRILPGQSDLLLWEGIQALSDAGYAYPKDKEHRMIDRIMNGNAESATGTLREILAKTTGYSLVTVQLTVSTLAIALLGVVEEIRKTSFVSLPPIVHESLLAVPALDGVESIDEIARHFEEIIAQICASLGDRRDARHMELLEYINALIENFYQDSNCSLAFIAEQANLSAAYVGRLYKHYTLRSIPETILDVRMEHARELLTNNRQRTIEQVAQQTGFSSGSYFSKTFRKMHGMTPNEYRSFALREQNQEEKPDEEE